MPAGRLGFVKIGGGRWTEKYSYSGAGRVARKRLSLTSNGASGSLDASWQYDNEGKMTSVKYPNTGSGGAVTGKTYTYTYDSMGRPQALSDGTSQVASSTTYGPAGELTYLAYGVSE